MHEYEKAYLAGYIDADGCISLTRYKSDKGKGWTLSLSVSSVHKDILDWIKKVTGDGVVKVVHYSKSQKKWDRHRCRKQWIWRARNNGMRRILPKILPYLKVKRRQAELVIEFLSLSSRGCYRPINDTIKQRIKRREEILDEMLILNHRGVLLEELQ